MPPDDVDQLRRVVVDLREQGGNADRTVRCRIGGETRRLRVVAETTDDAAGPAALHAVVQDVTVEERARRELAAVRDRIEDQERSLAQRSQLTLELQRIILPPLDDAQPLPGLDVAVRYQPATAVDRVGGDWYQAKRLSGGKVLLAIGDVAGHGLPAAATMAKLRHALTGLAVTSSNPARLLGWLNTVLWERRPAGYSTALVACYDPVRRVLTWAQAGHPSPLLARDGRTVPLRRPEGLLLGAIATPRFTNARVTLRPGDVLLFFTDGLVERPGTDFTEATGALARTLETLLRSAPTTRLGEILTGLAIDNPDDDVCILAAQLTDVPAPD